MIEKGYKLEEKIEKYFQLNGYRTERNVVIEGKSGAKHEIDVFAEKSDIVTTIRLMIECKAWDTPIEKNVVSKVHYVLNDINADKAIIVSLRGFRIGAKTASKKLGIELWGREELKNRLGEIEISKLEAVEFERIALGFSPSITQEQAWKVVESKRKKRFGAEKHAFTKMVYVPCFEIQFSYAVREGFVRKKEVVRNFQSLCEAIEGIFLGRLTSQPNEINLTTPIIEPKVKSSKLRKEIEKASKEYFKYVTPSAVGRCLRIIERSLGKVESADIRIDDITAIFYPFYAGLLDKDGAKRWVVVDALTGDVSERMNRVFNHNSTYVQQQIT